MRASYITGAELWVDGRLPGNLVALGSTPAEPHQARQARYKKGEGAGLGHCCRCHRQIAEQAMRLVVDTGAEVDGAALFLASDEGLLHHRR